MPDKETLDLIQDLQNQLDIQGAAMKDMFQLHSGTTMLLTLICAHLNPEQSDQIKVLQDDLEETRQRMDRYFNN